MDTLCNVLTSLMFGERMDEDDGIDKRRSYPNLASVVIADIPLDIFHYFEKTTNVPRESLQITHVRNLKSPSSVLALYLNRRKFRLFRKDKRLSSFSKFIVLFQKIVASNSYDTICHVIDSTTNPTSMIELVLRKVKNREVYRKLVSTYYDNVSKLPLSVVDKEDFQLLQVLEYDFNLLDVNTLKNLNRTNNIVVTILLLSWKSNNGDMYDIAPGMQKVRFIRTDFKKVIERLRGKR